MVALRLNPAFFTWLNHELSGTNHKMAGRQMPIAECDGMSFDLKGGAIKLDEVAIQPPNADEGFNANIGIKTIQVNGKLRVDKEQSGTYCKAIREMMSGQESLNISDTSLQVNAQIESSTLRLRDLIVTILKPGNSDIKNPTMKMLLPLWLGKILNTLFNEAVAPAMNLKQLFPVQVPFSENYTVELLDSPRTQTEIDDGITIFVEGRVKERVTKSVGDSPCPQPPDGTISASAEEIESAGLTMPTFDAAEGRITLAPSKAFINQNLYRWYKDRAYCKRVSGDLRNILGMLNPELPQGIALTASVFPSSPPWLRFGKGANDQLHVQLGFSRFGVQFGLDIEHRNVPMGNLTLDMGLDGLVQLDKDSIGINLLPKGSGGSTSITAHMAKDQPFDTSDVKFDLGLLNQFVAHSIVPQFSDQFIPLIPRDITNCLGLPGMTCRVEAVRVDNDFLAVDINPEGLRQLLILKNLLPAGSAKEGAS